MADSSDEEYSGRASGRRGGPQRARSLNEALATALLNGFPANTEMENFVTEEELKKEEDAAKSLMQIAEEKTKSILEDIKNGGKAEDKSSEKLDARTIGQAASKSEKANAVEDDSDSDDDEYYLKLEEAVDKIQAQDSIDGSVSERSKYIPLRLSYEGYYLCRIYSSPKLYY